jgi:pyridinium-3,5-biscarboxylic acid mononucleotide sulfurtransferase
LDQSTGKREREDQEGQDKLVRLRKWFADAGGAVVAYSGGTDSAFLLKVGHEVLSDRCVGVTVTSPSLPRAELQEAIELATEIGARHIVIESHELEDPHYRENTERRCYFCKSDAFTWISAWAQENGGWVVVDGTNADDLGDVRPGRDAAREHGVMSPLVEVGMTKQEIRNFSQMLGLRTWDKPSAACLSSRIPHGIEISPELLETIERAEAAVRRLTGVRQLRVRHHGKVARIEVEAADLLKVLVQREEITRDLRALGYHFIALDLDGFRSGSLTRKGARPTG